MSTPDTTETAAATGLTVRAAVLEQIGAPGPYAESRPLRVRELRLRPPGPGELLVRVRAAGLCHSDLSVVNGDRPRPVPMVLGHEAAGEVIALGAGADGRFAPGDHVVLYFVAPCGTCVRCLESRPALCERAAAANNAGDLAGGGRRWVDPESGGSSDSSASGKPGGAAPAHHLGVSAFAEHIVVSADSAVRVEPELPFEVAALFGCAVLTGVGAALNAAEVRPGERVAVFGLGGVGLSAVLGARVAGAAQIIGVDPVSAKRDIAARLGAAEQHHGGADAVAFVREATGGGADKVIDTTGNADVLAQAYAATRPGGTTVTVGLPHPDRMVSIPAVTLAAQERTLRGSYLGSGIPARDIPAYIALYRRGLLPVTELLSGRLRLDQVNEGFDRLASGEAVRQVILM